MRVIAIPPVFSLFVCLWMSLSAAQERPAILISYYSQQGHTRTMAEAVARGARSAGGVTVKLLGVGETWKRNR